MFRFLMALATAAGLLTTTPAYAADTFTAYAAPCSWGPAYPLRGHLGASTYTISFAPVGKTSILGEVTYVGTDGRPMTKYFNNSITIRTGNFVGQPKVRFKGVPFGSAVRVTVSP